MEKSVFYRLMRTPLFCKVFDILKIAQFCNELNVKREIAVLFKINIKTKQKMRTTHVANGYFIIYCSVRFHL